MNTQEYFTFIEENRGKPEAVAAMIVDGAGMGSRYFFVEGELKASVGEQILTKEEQRSVAGISATELLELSDKKIFAEVLQQKPKLVICGGGHVAQQVILLAKRTGFEITVLEDRPSFANEARAAGADRVICDDFDSALKQIPGSSSTFFLVVTRGHRFDGVCLKAILQKPRAYVGMMASRGRAALLKKQLEAEGVNKEGLEAIHTPVGLAIKAETPEEIAVSITAELILVKNSEKKTEGYEELFPYLTGREEADKGKVLATIVTRQGSAPRGIGTKMVTLEDGRLIGTLGGGCMEAEVRQKCLHMLRMGGAKSRLEIADLTNSEAEEEGLVCGGRIRVFLECV